MKSNKDHVELSINNLAFYWSFPEIVAIEEGYYQDEGIIVNVNDATPKTKVTSKNKMYENLQRKGLSNIYHAAEWVSIFRAAESEFSRIVAWSPWNTDALTSSFTIYAKNNSVITEPKLLQDKVIAVENGTGSYFTTIEDLEKYIPREKIKFKMMGDPHERLQAVLSDQVNAASLLGVYIDIAEHLKLTKIFESKRKKGTLMVTANEVSTDTLKKFIRGTNKAINSINKYPNKYQPKYFERFDIILRKIGKDIPISSKELRNTLRVPRWSLWQEYPKERFNDAYTWMTERNLVNGRYTYNDLVNNRAFSDSDD